jgi:hypothetical protein
MAKTPVYHLDECNDCVHRHVCKYVDKIDKLLKHGDLPLDLQGASCHEFLPEEAELPEEYEEPQDSISFTVKYMGNDHDIIQGLRNSLQPQFLNNQPTEEIVPINPEASIDAKELIDGLDRALFEVLEKGFEIHRVAMNRETMDMLKPAFNATQDLVAISLMDGSKVKLIIDNSVATGIFAIDVKY